MEIIVQGSSEKSFAPNELNLNFTFLVESSTYKDALNKGVESVKEGFDLLQSIGFCKEQLKTSSMSICEKQEYNEETRKYIKIGFEFSQNVKLKFDYSITKMATIIEEILKLKNSPTYSIEFTLKDKEKAKEELLTSAMFDAQKQAEIIAKANGKSCVECKKVSFEPLNNTFSSCTDLQLRQTRNNASFCMEEGIKDIFVPEDIVLQRTVYCLFETK